MFKKNQLLFCCISIFTIVCLPACRSKPEEKDIVVKKELLDDRIKHHLENTLDFASGNSSRINDTTTLSFMHIVNRIYKNESFRSVWSADGKWNRISDSLYSFIKNSMQYGLFPSDYHFRPLMTIRSLVESDTTAMKDAVLWARADILLTDALLLLSKDLKQGRIKYDSVSQTRDTLLTEDFYLATFNKIRQTRNVKNVLEELEPIHERYVALKEGLKQFLDSAQFRRNTYLVYTRTDSAGFYRLLQKRLFEENLLMSATESYDTATWRTAIRTYQVSKELKPTGIVNEALISNLNFTDWEKFKRIAITLDRYKLLADTLPQTYVWVNIPSYELQVFHSDSIALESRVIVGSNKTRTPVLNSEISNFITFPQWTVPYSIVFKEMVPQIKKDLNYFNKENLMVVDRNDSVLNPASIDWTKVNKNNFPYQIKQREGDNNSLGVLKFNFRNKYSVYLHDTNARWLFSRKNRAMSHGCVRVQKWEKLAQFLVREDTIRYHPDTLRKWIVRQEKHVVSGFPKVPIYIRYYSCEGKDGKVKFYEDIYGEDKILRDRYFASKPSNYP